MPDGTWTSARCLFLSFTRLLKRDGTCYVIFVSSLYSIVPSATLHINPSVFFDVHCITIQRHTLVGDHDGGIFSVTFRARFIVTWEFLL